MQQRDFAAPSSSSSFSFSFPPSPPTPSPDDQSTDPCDLSWLHALPSTAFEADSAAFEATLLQSIQVQGSQPQAHLVQQGQSPSVVNLKTTHASPSSADLPISQPPHHLIQPYVARADTATRHLQQQKQFGSPSYQHHPVASSPLTSFSTSSESSGSQAYENGTDRYELHQHQQQQHQHQQGQQLPYPLRPSSVAPPPRASSSSKAKGKSPSKGKGSATPASSTPAHPYLPAPSNSGKRHPVQQPSTRQKKIPSTVASLPFGAGPSGTGRAATGEAGMVGVQAIEIKDSDEEEDDEIKVFDGGKWVNFVQQVPVPVVVAHRSAAIVQPTVAEPTLSSTLSFPQVEIFSPPRQNLSTPSLSPSSSISPPCSASSNSPPAHHWQAQQPAHSPPISVHLPFVAVNLIPARSIPSTITVAQLFQTLYYPTREAETSGTLMNSVLQELDGEGRKTGNVFWTSELWHFFEAQQDVVRTMEFTFEMNERGEMDF